MCAHCVGFVVTVPTKTLRRSARESFLNKPGVDCTSWSQPGSGEDVVREIGHGGQYST